MIFKMGITELKQERATLIKKQRRMLEENDTLSSEQKSKWDRIDEDIDKLEDRIAKLQKTEEREKELAKREFDMESGKEEKADYAKTYDKYLREGRSNLELAEKRALQEDTDSEGGYLVPDTFASGIMQALEERNVMRRIATVESTSSPTKFPVASDTGSATWVAEEGAFSNTDPSFSQKTVDAYKAGTIIKVSEELLYDNTYNLEGYLQSRFVRRIGDLEETAFVSGNGTGKPTGFLEDAESGKTASATDAITAEELIDLYHAPKTPYRRNARFLMNDSSAKAIRKLTDSNGQYIWQPGLQAGQPDVLLGRPVEISADMPEIATGNSAVAFGDFSYYNIFDREGIFIQRLNELYAENGQVGYRAYKRVDGLLMLAEAIQTLDLA